MHELRLTGEESRDLAGALHEVQRHYQIPVLSDKYMALAVLAYTAGAIYTGKARAIMDRQAGNLAPGTPAGEAGPMPAPIAQAAPAPTQAAPDPWFDPNYPEWLPN